MEPPFPAHTLMHKANQYGLASLCQPRQAAAEGRDPDRRAAEDRERHRQPDPRAGAGAEEVGAVAGSQEAMLDMTAPDYIIVGSGINALVCAALLGRKGGKVLVLERNDRIGGCIRTEEITAPGFVHDVMATTFVLFITSPAYAALAADLGRHGLEFCHTDDADRRAPARRQPPRSSAWTARPTSPPSTLGRRRRAICRRCRRDREERRPALRPARRRAVDLSDLQAARRRSLAPGPARPRRLPRRGA